MSDASLFGILQAQIANVGQDELPVRQPLLKLGRGQANDVILEGPNVSGNHAQLIWGQLTHSQGIKACP
jgi:hypothetical protein